MTILTHTSALPLYLSVPETPDFGRSGLQGTAAIPPEALPAYGEGITKPALTVKLWLFKKDFPLLISE